MLTALKNLINGLFPKKAAKTASKQRPKRPPEELKALLEKYKEAVRANPQDGMGQYNLGEVYIELNRFADAVSPLKEAVRINAKHKSAHYQLGKALVELGRDDEALEFLQQALELDPKSPAVKKRLAQAHTNLSILYGKRKQQKESMHHFQEAVKILPDYGPAHLSLGICYTELGRYDEALEKFKEALRLDKNLVVDANFNFGIVYTKLGETGKAIKHYMDAIRVNPKSALPNLNLGMLYARLGKHEEAAKFLGAALKASPGMAREANFKLGVSLMKLKRFVEAVPPLQKAVKITPNNEKVRDHLAEAQYQAAKQHREAKNLETEIEALQEAVDMNPEHAMAHYWLGLALDQNNEGGYAIQHLTIAKQFFVEKGQDDWFAQTIRALQPMYKRHGRTPEDYAKIKIPRK